MALGAMALFLLSNQSADWARSVERLTVNELARSYVLHRPVTAAGVSSPPKPLVIALHGVTSNANALEATMQITSWARTSGFIAAIPNGSGQLSGWNVGFLDLSGNKVDDVAFIGRVIEDVQSKTAIDPKQIFVIGHSNGAMLANLVGSRLGDKVAAIASIAGTIGTNMSSGSRIPDPVSPVSVLLMHGKQDKVVGYDASSRALFTGISAPDCAKFWARANRCSNLPVTEIDADDRWRKEHYILGRSRTEVVLITSRDGDHEIPGSFLRNGREKAHGFVATEEIWKFFSEHPKP